MIVAGPDGFIKNQYRKFNIKSEGLTPGDDYAMMREVLQRRFKRLLNAAGGRRCRQGQGRTTIHFRNGPTSSSSTAAAASSTLSGRFSRVSN